MLDLDIKFKIDTHPTKNKQNKGNFMLPFSLSLVTQFQWIHGSPKVQQKKFYKIQKRYIVT